MFRTIIFLYILWFATPSNALSVSSYSDILKKAIPSVVSIYSAKYKSQVDIDNFYKADFFPGSAPNSASVGTGVIIDKSGIIVTNYHVVSDKNAIKIILENGLVLPAKVYVLDRQLDLALLQVSGDVKELKNLGLSPITIEKSNTVEVGDVVLAIGNPFGIGISSSIGIVSALPKVSGLRGIGMGSLVQTDAMLNPGNSGGALVDQKGRLVGINTAVLSPGGNASGIGFAIPSDVVMLFVQRAIAGKKFKQYWLGLSGVNISNANLKNTSLKIPNGVIVRNIHEGGPADLAKLQEGDIITKLNGYDIKTVDDLIFTTALLEDDQAIEISIIRDSKAHIFSISPQLPVENVKREETKIDFGPLSGLTVINNSQAVAYEFGIGTTEQAVVVSYVKSGSVAHKIGIRQGDIIATINDEKIANVEDLVNTLFLGGGNLSIIFIRNGHFFDVTIST